jgi:hypothetical protein
MKKLTTLALAGAMAVSSLASASVTRWTGFGVASLFIADVQDSFTLPQTVATNGDALYLEFGSQYHYDGVDDYWTDIPGTPADYSVDDSAWGGAHLKLGPGVLGIWGNRPYSGASGLVWADEYNGYGFPNVTNGGPNADNSFLTPQNTVDLFYAWEMGDKITLGIGLNHSQEFYHWQDKTIWFNDIYDQTACDWGVSLGLDIKDLGPIATLQIGLQYNNGSAKNTADDGSVVNSNTMGYDVTNLRVGADIAGSKGKFQRAELGVNVQNGHAETVPGNGIPTDSYASESATALSWDLGWAMGMSSAKGMGLSGLILTGGNTSSTAPNYNGNFQANDHTETNGLGLTFASAGEGKINNWLTGRAGFATTLYGSEGWNRRNRWTSGNTGRLREESYSTYMTTITLGLGIQLGDIVVDGALNQDLLYNGLYFTNGIATPLFSQVSATWAWGSTKE